MHIDLKFVLRVEWITLLQIRENIVKKEQAQNI